MKKTVILILVALALSVVANAALANPNGTIMPMSRRDAALASANGGIQPLWERGGGADLQSANGGIQPLSGRTWLR